MTGDHARPRPVPDPGGVTRLATVTPPHPDRGAEPAPDPLGDRLRRLTRFLAVTCLLCAVAAFPGSALFALDRVTVRGTANLTADDVLRRIGIRPGDSAFQVDAAAIRRRLREDPRIADAAVALAFPHRLTVTIRERAPVAALASGDGYVLLGADGVAIARAAAPGPALPLVVDRLHLPWVQPGTPVPSARVRFGVSAAAALPPDLRSIVIGARVDTAGDVELETRDGVWLKLGDAQGLAERLELAPRVLAAIQARGIRARYLDLRVPGSVVVMPETGQEKPPHRGIDARPPYPVPP